MRKTIGKINKLKVERKERRKLSIRKKIVGTAERPRLNVFKGNKNLYIQVIDDSRSYTLVSCQTFGKNKIGTGANVESAKLLGSELAKKLGSSNVKNVVFDRGGQKYCGVIASLADSLRENGISL